MITLFVKLFTNKLQDLGLYASVIDSFVKKKKNVLDQFVYFQKS